MNEVQTTMSASEDSKKKQKEADDYLSKIKLKEIFQACKIRIYSGHHWGMKFL